MLTYRTLPYLTFAVFLLYLRSITSPPNPGTIIACFHSENFAVRQRRG